jgi:hypothetical protein
VFVKRLPLRGDEARKAAISKSHLSVAQRVVSSVRKAMRMREDRSEPSPKVKLNGPARLWRWGYSVARSHS